MRSDSQLLCLTRGRLADIHWYEQMLGTSERRLVIEDTEEGRLPVPFDSASGIKVQTLPSPAFRVVNYL